MATTASNAEKDTNAKLSFEYGGQTYKAVKIGTQIWMAENLNYEAEGSKFYENNPDNGAKYGRLYTWETAMKVCPKGWHLPTGEEWNKLLCFVGDDTKYLKAVSGWKPWNGIEYLDPYGFSAQPGGYGSLNGSFFDIGNCGYWCIANKYGGYFALRWSSTFYYGIAGQDNLTKSSLFSIRCVQD